MQRDQNVVVIVRETLKAEYVIALTDVEGKFLQNDLVYRETPLRRKHTLEDAQIIEDIRQQLEEANQVITSATAKDEEQARIISDLQDALCERDEAFSPSIPGSATSVPDSRRRQGKAPPIEFFSREDPSVLLDAWLPSLERASTWNGWSVEDKLMQLPEYLRGRALQEWRLLPQSDQQSYPEAIKTLRARLDPGSKTIAAQEFRHTLQQPNESVPDFIRRLEKTYQTAYGKDGLTAATRDALLYGQLYEGLCYNIMLSPAVSVSQSYRELSTATKGEERRLVALKQRQQLAKSTTGLGSPPPPRATKLERHNGKNPLLR